MLTDPRVVILFKTQKLKKLCNEEREAVRRLGRPSAEKLRVRLDDLEAAAALLVMASVGGRCHELKGDLRGRLALDLANGERLVFEPVHEPIPVKGDGGLDWSKVTCIRIVSVGNYHD